MKTERQHTYSKVLRDWENTVGPNHKLSLSEASCLADKVGEEFRSCEPLERILKSFETQTSSPHTFDEVKYVFCAFYQKPKELLIWLVKLLRQLRQQKQR